MIELRNGYLVELMNDQSGVIEKSGNGASCIYGYGKESIITRNIRFGKIGTYDPYAIKKVYGTSVIGNDRPLLWDLAKEEKEMTLEEIEKALGHKVKIISK